MTMLAHLELVDVLLWLLLPFGSVVIGLVGGVLMVIGFVATGRKRTGFGAVMLSIGVLLIAGAVIGLMLVKPLSP